MVKHELAPRRHSISALNYARVGLFKYTVSLLEACAAESRDYGQVCFARPLVNNVGASPSSSRGSSVRV